jgi:hypothetical protein
VGAPGPKKASGCSADSPARTGDDYHLAHQITPPFATALSNHLQLK